ncbi:MAG TPA: ATP-binding protein [Chitinispirillaceae bacterium]|nr:ATP-binding protein [Chitinispirillaceae bacterium]
MSNEDTINSASYSIPATILIVDDQPKNLAVIGDYLMQFGFTILVSQTGVGGLRRARDVMPDLILLDVLMPDMDGFETCRRLKADESTRNIPVIFMTALTGVEDKVKGFELGGVDYITKPIQHEEVLARVKTHLQIVNQKKQLELQAFDLEKINIRLNSEIETRKAAENELQKLNEELEDRIKSRTEELTTIAEQLHHVNVELEKANKELKKVDEEKTEFVALASHELRTPLTSILGYAQTLLVSEQQLDSSIRTHILSTIVSESRRLASLIGNLLDISKIETNNFKIKTEPFIISEVIHNVINALNLPSDFPLVVNNAVLNNCKVVGNREQTGQVIRNILDNALRYVKEKGCITINVNESEDYIRVGISDTGPGIKPEEQKKIFGKFYRVRDEKNRSIGSGLGLSISANIIKSQGGKIWVESKYGEGATFYFTLPKEMCNE